MRKPGTISVLLVLLASVLFAQGWRGSEVVALQVTDAKGRSIAGARVTLTFQGIPGEIGPAIVATDSRGHAVFADLAPGPWQVEVDHPDYLSYVAMIDVRRGKKPLVSASFLEAGGRSLSPVRVKFSKGDPSQASPVLEARQPTAPTAVRPEPAPAAEAEGRATEGQIAQIEPENPSTPAATSGVAPQVDEEPAPVETSLEAAQVPTPEPTPITPELEPTDAEPEVAETLPTPAVEPTVAEPAVDEPLPTPETEPTVAEPVAAEPLPTPDMEPIEEEVPASPAPTVEETQIATDPTTPTRIPSPIEEPTAEPEAPTPTLVTPAPTIPEEEPPLAPEPESGPETGAVPEIPAAEPHPEEPLAPAPRPAAGSLPMPPDPGMRVSSASDGSCADCQSAEWSLTTSAPVAAAAPGSPAGCGTEVLEAARSAMEGLANSIQLELAGFIGPAADGSSKQAIARVEPDVAEPFQSSLATYVGGSSPCQLVGIVIPKSLRFSRVRLSATGEQGTSECSPGQECPIGEARWIGGAQVARGHSATVVYGVFQNLATNQGRRAGLTVYFRPPDSNWRPRIPSGP